MKKWMVAAAAAGVVAALILAGCNMAKEEDGGKSRLQEIYNGVFAAYDQRYDSWTAVDKDTLRDTYGITEHMVEDIIAMAGKWPRVFIGIRCAKGQESTVQRALENAASSIAARDYDNSASKAIATAGKVVAYGDYVFYLVMGEPAGEDLQASAATEMAKGLTALEEFFADGKYDSSDKPMDDPAAQGSGIFGGTGEEE